MTGSQNGSVRLVTLALVCLACSALPALAQPVEPADEPRALFADCAVLGGYDRSWCEAEQKRFIDLYRRALRRDYHSQRRIALCLTSGCDGAVAVNRAMACGWRMLIVGSGSPYVDLSDARNHRQDCAGLTAQERAAAHALAADLMTRIYGRPLPALPAIPLAG